jgi:ELWxxDGT repeat protein/autotransporter-associated beta strand protein
MPLRQIALPPASSYRAPQARRAKRLRAGQRTALRCDPAIECLEDRCLLDAALVKDINDWTNAGITPATLTEFNGSVLFSGFDGDAFGGLWKSDGTDAGTIFMKAVSGLPGNLTKLNGMLYFITSSALWKTDGTAAGTVVVFNWGSGVSSLTLAGTQLFMVANDSAAGIELWMSDGTTAGTVLAKDIFPGGSSSSPSNLTAVGSTLFFKARDGTNGVELWKSDGTGSGTSMVKDLTAGNNSFSAVSQLTAAGSTLFFTFTDATAGNELWRSNGLATGTDRVADINPGSGSSSPQFLTYTGGTLYFQANDGTNGTELWKSDGTGLGTVLVKDINATGSSTPASLSVANGVLFFRASDGASGSELWKSDGSATGTTRVKDINVGAGSSSPAAAFSVGNTLYFNASDGSASGLWKSDGTEAGTVLVRAPLSAAVGVAELGGVSLFGATLGKSSTELWTTDGTTTGTQLVKEINRETASAVSAGGPGGILSTVCNGRLFYYANDGTNGSEPWVSDGTAAGTQMLKDINPGSGGSSDNIFEHQRFVNLNGTLFFNAYDPVNGEELWKSDGTTAGTVLVKDINSGTNNAFIDYITAAGNYVYFWANAGSGVFGLWRSDGTDAGTILLKNLNNIGYPVAVNGSLYFASDELWKSDGTPGGTVVVKDINPAGDSDPKFLTDVNGTLFFQADDGSHGLELWKSDGTSGGTVMVKDIAPGSASSTAQIANFNGTAVFSATDGTTGLELWKSNGTDAGTVLVKDINAGSASSSPNYFSVGSGTLYFAATTATHGTELWKSDGTATGTVLVKDIWPGTSSSSPQVALWQPFTGFTPAMPFVDGSIFFTADDGTAGREMWYSDGTPGNTNLLRDIRPGPAGSQPSHLAGLNDAVLFAADDAETGNELWTATISVRVWDGGGSTNNWSEAANWSGDRVPLAVSDVVFDGTSSKDSMVDAAFAGSVADLTINAGYSGTISLGRSLSVGSLAGSTGQLALGSNRLTTGSNNSHTTFDGVLSGVGGLTKTGKGSFYLRQGSSYDGPTTIENGSILVSVNNALGSPNGGTTVGGGVSARLVFERGVNYTTPEPITINGGGFNGLATLAGLGNSSFTGPISVASTSTIGAYPAGSTFTLSGAINNNGYGLNFVGTGDTVLAGVISGSGTFTKDGTGMVTISNSNSYSGVTTVKAGTLRLNGSVASDVTIKTGAVLGGTGTVGASIVNGGTLSPALQQLGILSGTSGDFSAGGVLRTQVSGYATAGVDFDRYNLSGTVTLGGTSKLSLDLVGLTSTGTASGIIRYSSRIGAFATVELLNNPNNYSVCLSYGSSSLDAIIQGGACAQWVTEDADTVPVHALLPQSTRDWARAVQPVTIAMLDSGVDYTHPMVARNVWINQGEIPAEIRARLRDRDGNGRFTLRDLNWRINRQASGIADSDGNGMIDGGDLLRAWSNGNDDDANGYVDDLIGWDFANNDNDPMDDSGHGTHGAGVITRVAPRAEIVPLKLLDARDGGSLADASRALDYALNQGISISNNGWSASVFSPDWFAELQKAEAAGHLFVTAAGNGDPALLDIVGHSHLSNVLVVAATDSKGALASFANWDPDIVDLALPGVSVTSALPNGEYAPHSGTSVSTAIATAFAALLKSRHGDWNRAALVDAILAKTRASDEPNEHDSGIAMWAITSDAVNRPKEPNASHDETEAALVESMSNREAVRRTRARSRIAFRVPWLK